MRSKNLSPGLTNNGKKVKRLNYKQAILLLCLLSFNVTMFAQPYATVALTGYNQDIISNGIGTALSSGSLSTGFDGVNYNLVAQDYNSSGNIPVGTAYLPNGGLLPSATISGLTYQLAPYTGNNALWLNSTSASGTLNFVTPRAAITVYVLGTSGSGASNFNITVNFSDLSTQIFTGLSYTDWYGSGGDFVNIGRVNISNNIAEQGGSNDPMLYRATLIISVPNATKLITGITVARVAGGTGFTGFVAVSLNVPPVLASSATSLPAFSTQACSISAGQSFTIQGANLTASGSITATAPSGFQVSNDSLSWGSTAAFAYSGINLNATKVYVRYLPAIVGLSSGNITFSGGGVTSFPTVAVSGNGTAITAITGAGNICPGFTLPLADATTGGSWSSCNTAVATVATATGVVTGVSAGTATIIYTLPCGANTNTVITILNAPAALTAGNVCVGSTLTLNDATTGGNWTSSNTAVAAIGLSTGIMSGTVAGTSTITYTLLSTGCFVSAPVTVNPLPSLFSVTQTGGTSYCAGSPSPIQIGLSGSSVGVNYQLFGGVTPVGSALPGTGSPLSFGSPPGTGSFTVVGSYPTGCSATMTGSGSISTTPAPNLFIVTGSASFCAGTSASAHIHLSGSTSGIKYMLYNGATLVDSLTGTGTILDFGSRSVAGVYTILAVNPVTGCSRIMGSSATLTINPLPNVYSVTGGGGYCAGTPGEHVGLSNSNPGINYSLFLDGTFVDSVAGSGAPINFGLTTSTGVYTVVADNPATGCVSSMSGSTAITVSSVPASFNVTGGGNYCTGGTGVSIGLDGSETTAFYQAVNGATPVGGPLTGIGTAFNLGSSFVSTGTYIVVATSIINGCKDTMAGNVTVGINPLPLIYSVSGGGGYCVGGTGVPVLLSNGDAGITYQLYYGTTPLGDSVEGPGAPLNFGNVTAAGIYRVVAVDATTGCKRNMAGTVTVVINSSPDAYTVTGGGAYCSSDGGRHVGLSFSNTGINYQLYADGVLIDSVPGSGAAIDFGLLTGPASYTVFAINTTTLCSSNMTGSAVLISNLSPFAYNVVGGGDYCAGTAGVHVRLDGSDAGVSYRAYKGGLAVGSAVIGVGGSPVDFGTFTAAGTYTVIGTASGCSTMMTGNTVISIDPPPHAFLLSGGGSICASGTGADITLNGSNTGVNYQLFNAGLAIGSALPGTGASLDFGPQTSGGSYTVVATDGIGCTNNMTGAPNINILPAPSLHTITGGGHYCTGSTGRVVGLDGSNPAVHYQLNLGGSPVGSMITGTGFALNFGSYTTGGNYTVVATNPVNGCSATMTGSVTITMDALPTPETMAGGGSYCIGGTGVDVSLGASQSGFSYQLLRGGVSTGLPPAIGLGDPIDFGSQTLAGTYTVVSTDPSTGCSANMPGSAVVTISAPTVYTVLGSATFCQGSTASHITLSGSQMGVNYQLNNGSLPIGLPEAGTGLALDLGIPPASGTYNIVATDATSGCMINMAGSAAIVINASPALHAVTGGGAYCSSGPGVHIGLDVSDAGISYRLYYGTTATGAALTGTGTGLDFGLITVAGSYKVIATNTSTSCTNTMLDTVAVIIKPSPAVFTVTADHFGNYCAGGTGVHINLSGSVTGISYKLYHYAAPLSTLGGTGSGLDFGLQTAAGPYSVIATDPVIACDNNMSGSPVVNIVPVPVAHNVNGGGGYCPGGLGMDVLLDGSNSGMYYQLYNASIPVGSPVPGTGIVLDFGYRHAGNYTVIGTNTVITSGDTTTCTNPMTGAAIVTLDTLLLPSVAIHAFPTGTVVSHIDSIKVVATNGGPDPTYQWYINGNLIPGANQAVYTALQFFDGDSVSCTVTSSGPCGGRSASNYVIIHLSKVGVAPVNATGNNIKLIPNPNKGIFNLKGILGNAADEELSMEVTNMLGQVVYTNKIMTQGGNIDQRIELNSTLSNGMYIMTLHSATQNNVIHFVIEQ